jgi:hypothetical protein
VLKTVPLDRRFRVDEVDAPFRLIGVDAHFVADLDESERVILPVGGDFDHRRPVLAVQQLPAALQVLQRACSECAGEQVRRPGRS